MSNYQMLRAMAVRWEHPTTSGSGVANIIKPADNAWWDHFVEFMQDRYDSPDQEVARARKGELPRFFYPSDGSIVTPDDGWDVLAGDYWVSILMDYEFFWQSLWKAGNRGRVVAEFQSEGSFGYEGSTEYIFTLPGNGGGMYTVSIDLTDDGCTRTIHYDDRYFYEEVQYAHDDALQEQLAEEGVETAEELEYGYFEWSASDAIECYYIHQRHELIDYPDNASDEWARGFGA